MSTHKDLDCWKESIELVVDIYNLTKSFPSNENYGLTSQIKRASVSVPSNIAEGAARQTTKEFIQFLYIALGSLSEVETQLVIAQKVKLITDIKDINDRIILVRKLLTGLIKYLKGKL